MLGLTDSRAVRTGVCRRGQSLRDIVYGTFFQGVAPGSLLAGPQSLQSWRPLLSLKYIYKHLLIKLYLKKVNLVHSSCVFKNTISTGFRLFLKFLRSKNSILLYIFNALCIPGNKYDVLVEDECSIYL